MRILIFNWRDIKHPKAGGAEVYIHENAKQWVKEGHDVAILTSSFKGAAEQDDVIDGIKIYRVGGTYTVYLRAMCLYLSKLKDKYDVIVDAVNTIPFFTPLYVRKPIISLIFQFTRDVYFKVFPWLIAQIAYHIEPLLFKLYKKHAVVVLSESIKQELVEDGFAGENIFVVEPGVGHVEMTSFKKTKMPTIVYLNRIIQYKNPDHVVLALPEIKKQIPEAKLVITGFRFDNAYEKKVKSLIKELNLQEDVKTYGFISGDKKRELLQSSWVHVLPSIREGWGISVIEAGYYGTPTVGYDTVGLRDSVQDGKTGILVPSGDIKALADAITKMLKEDELRNRMEKNVSDYARTFNYDQKAKVFLAVIEQKYKP
ncbi:MAG: glycosyltransferase family 4 protein [PVC group bacterium]|nr:glycosyltransferase family 4 protein [PVC group bacterium]